MSEDWDESGDGSSAPAPVSFGCCAAFVLANSLGVRCVRRPLRVCLCNLKGASSEAAAQVRFATWPAS